MNRHFRDHSSGARGSRRLLVTAAFAVLAVPILALAAPVGPMNEFADGDIIRADDFNENFDALAAAINDNDTRITSLEGDVSAAASVPSGAVMFFNLASCPNGWTEATAMRGRVAMGLPNGGDLGDTVGDGLTNLGTRTITQVPAHTHAATGITASTNNTGGHTHTVNSSGAHNHTVNMGYPGDFGGYATTAFAGSATTNNFGVTTPFGGTSGAHTHTMVSNGAHEHTVTIAGSTASTGIAAVDVTMPYMQLLACQKT